MASLGQTLLKHRFINLIQLNLALDFKVFYGGRLGTNLLELGVISENTLAECLAESLGMPATFRQDFENIPDAIIQRFSRELAYHTQALPFRKVGQTLHIVCLDPRNQQAMELLKAHIQQPFLLHVAPELRVQWALQEYYDLPMDPRMLSLSRKNFFVSPEVNRSKRVADPVQAPERLFRQEPRFPTKPEPLTKPQPSVDSGPWLNDIGGVFQPKPGATDSTQSNPARVARTPRKVALSVQSLAYQMEEAQTRDEIAQLILEFSQRFLKRVGLFILRKDIAFGWAGVGPGFESDRIKSIVIPLGEPSIFQIVVESQGHFLGAVPDTPVNNRFCKALGEIRPENVLLLPLTIGGITFGVIYGDNVNTSVESDGINEMQVLVSRANIAFERLIIAERQKALNQHASI